MRGGRVRKDGVSSSFVPRPASSRALMYSAGLTHPPHKHRPRLSPDIPPGANSPSRRSSPHSCPPPAVAPLAPVPPPCRRHPLLLHRHPASPTPPRARQPPPAGCSRVTPCLGAGRVRRARGRGEAPKVYTPPSGAGGSTPPARYLSTSPPVSQPPQPRRRRPDGGPCERRSASAIPPSWRHPRHVHPRPPRPSCPYTAYASTVCPSPGGTASPAAAMATPARRRRCRQAPRCAAGAAKFSALVGRAGAQHRPGRACHVAAGA